jgi:hypothetical protein
MTEGMIVAAAGHAGGTSSVTGAGGFQSTLESRTRRSVGGLLRDFGPFLRSLILREVVRTVWDWFWGGD